MTVIWGFKQLFTSKLDNILFARFYKNWSQSKKKAFTKSCTKWADDLGKKEIEKELNQMKKYCTTIRIIVHTQMKLLRRR